MTGPGRDGEEIEALVTDRYLERLVAALSADRPVALDPSGPRDAAVDPGVARAAARIQHLLPRFHPSFRFEERLSLRLADVAAAMRLPAAAGGEGTVVPLAVRQAAGPDPVDLLAAGPLDDGPAEHLDLVRPLLVGGALTSAALSLAGAAWVAWRRTHPASTPMARAVRAVARGRPA